MTARNLRELHRQLQTVQRRLGTSHEEPGDFDRVLSLAHEINNAISSGYLRAVLETDHAAPSLVNFSRQQLTKPEPPGAPERSS